MLVRASLTHCSYSGKEEALSLCDCLHIAIAKVIIWHVSLSRALTFQKAEHLVNLITLGTSSLSFALLVVGDPQLRY